MRYLGVAYESAYPYVSGGNARPTTCRDVAPVEKNVQYTPLKSDDASITDWLANKGPVGFAF